MTSPLIVGENIGGQPKTRYWTPDGREICACANMHTTSSGGVRDANFDFGWLPSKPSSPLPYCPHCDRWHDTEEEVEACGERRKASDVRFMKIAKKQIKAIDASKVEKGIDITEVEALRSELAEMKEMIANLAKEKINA